MARTKIILNDPEIIRAVLQQAYDAADSQIIQAQNEINKFSNSIRLQDEVVDAKSKYAKAINDYLSLIDKSISKKVEIAKLLTEILNHSSNGGQIDAQNVTRQSFDLTKIKEMVKNMHNDSKEETKTIELKK